MNKNTMFLKQNMVIDMKNQVHKMKSQVIVLKVKERFSHDNCEGQTFGLLSQIKNTSHIIDWKNIETIYLEKKYVKEKLRAMKIKNCKNNLVKKKEEIKSISEISENLFL